MIPGVSHLNGADWLVRGARHASGSRSPAGPVRFDLITTMTTLGIGVLQAVVIISIIQLIFSPVRGFAGLAARRADILRARSCSKWSSASLLFFGLVLV